jgi:histidinol-phosphate aminotransferase
LFVVDEAYLAFAPGLASVVGHHRDNLLVLRSLTKDYALAGLRLGYAIGSAPMIETLARVRPPWSVNAFAQAAGVAALNDGDHLRQSLTVLQQAKAELLTGLSSLGLAPVPSAAPFFLLPVGNGAFFRRALLRQRIVVRDAASFGLPGYVRISTRTPEQNERLLQAIRDVRHARAQRPSIPCEVPHGR